MPKKDGPNFDQCDVSDIWLACYLVAIGKKVVETWDEGRRMNFKFNVSFDDLEQHQLDFENDKKVSARKFADAHKSLKRLIFRD